jgi:hypothetical protein
MFVGALGRRLLLKIDTQSLIECPIKLLGRAVRNRLTESPG